MAIELEVLLEPSMSDISELKTGLSTANTHIANITKAICANGYVFPAVGNIIHYDISESNTITMHLTKTYDYWYFDNGEYKWGRIYNPGDIAVATNKFLVFNITQQKFVAMNENEITGSSNKLIICFFNSYGHPAGDWVKYFIENENNYNIGEYDLASSWTRFNAAKKASDLITGLDLKSGDTIQIKLESSDGYNPIKSGDTNAFQLLADGSYYSSITTAHFGKWYNITLNKDVTSLGLNLTDYSFLEYETVVRLHVRCGGFGELHEDTEFIKSLYGTVNGSYYFDNDGSEYNMIDSNRVTDQGYIDDTTGAIVPYETYEYTDYIEVKPEFDYSLLAKYATNSTNVHYPAYYAFYTDNKRYISGSHGEINEITAPAKARYIRISWFKSNNYTNVTFALSTTLSSYVNSTATLPEYKVRLSDDVELPLDGEYLSYKHVLPEYYKSHLASKIDSINQAERASGVNGATYAFITDMHVNYNSLNSLALLERIKAKTNAYHCFYGGDSVRAWGSTSEIYDDNAVAMNGLYSVFGKDISYSIGNHDWMICNNADHEWGRDMQYVSVDTCYATYNKKTGVTTKKLYHYWDDAENNIRHIIIDYLTVGTSEFVTWFKSAIETAPANCVFCLYAHVNPYFKDGSRNSEIKCDHIIDWLSAIKKKTTLSKTYTYTGSTVTVNVDYSNTTYDVAYFMAGHWHADFAKKVEGVNYIVTTCDAHYNDDESVTRTAGTVSEQAFDVVHINTNTKKVKLFRIGGGSDREFTY